MPTLPEKLSSKIDLRSAYHQVDVAPEHRNKVVFNTPFDLFRCLRMPFGLKNAGQLFQRNVHLLFDNCHFVFAYLDDFIIASASPAKHLRHLHLVFDLLTEKQLKVQPEKCVLAQPSLEFLGHVMDSQGIRIPDSLIEATRSFQPPANVKDLERFLGIFAFVHRFVPHASTLAASLNDLRSIKREAVFKMAWQDPHDRVQP